MRLTVRASMALVALAAAALSYQSLMHLGELCGYGSLSVLYPLVVDAGAAASCAAWLYTRGRQPLVMTWCLLAVSVVLNGTTHYLESTGTAPSWLLVVAVAAVPPTVLGLCVHLAVGLGTTERPDQLAIDGAPAGPSTSGVWGGTTNATQADNPLTGPAEGRDRPDRLDHWHGEPAGSTASGVSRSEVDNTQRSEGQTAMDRPGQTSERGWGLPGSITPDGPQGRTEGTPELETQTPDPVAELISSGVGRRKLATELGISEHQARVMLEQRRNGHANVQA